MQMGFLFFALFLIMPAEKTKSFLSSAHYCCSQGGKKYKKLSKEHQKKLFAARRSVVCREHLVKPALCGCTYVTSQSRSS